MAENGHQFVISGEGRTRLCKVCAEEIRDDDAWEYDDDGFGCHRSCTPWRQELLREFHRSMLR